MSGAPFSLSFSGGGFLAIYEIGVIQGLLEQAPEILRSAPKVYGASSGSVIAAAVVCGLSLGKQCIDWDHYEWLYVCKKTIYCEISEVVRSVHLDRLKKHL